MWPWTLMGPNPLPPDSAARRRRFNGGSEYFAYIIEGPPPTKFMKKHAGHAGIGAVVGFVFFFTYYYGWFGMPPMDLVGSMGIGFGSGFSASVISYMMSRDK